MTEQEYEVKNLQEKQELAVEDKKRSKVHRAGRMYSDEKNEKNEQFLLSHGFMIQMYTSKEDDGTKVELPNIQRYEKGELWHYKNPTTGQRAQVMKGKNGKGSLSFFAVTPQKRRTKEQKERDERTSIYD